MRLQAVKLVRGVRISQDDSAFTFSVFSFISWFKARGVGIRVPSTAAAIMGSHALLRGHALPANFLALWLLVRPCGAPCKDWRVLIVQVVAPRTAVFKLLHLLGPPPGDRGVPVERRAKAVPPEGPAPRWGLHALHHNEWADIKPAPNTITYGAVVTCVCRQGRWLG